MADLTQKQAEQKILENAANPVQQYSVDGEQTTMKDPARQLDALDRLARRRAARNPLGAILTLKVPSGTGER
ncbi:MAG: hypothetical protein IJT83_13895 [Victivallales bacterium]|nr:hypothetical protein [Victivallales bacterium]